MINDIVKAISTALYNAFGYENHVEKMEQDSNKPCFLISCINASALRCSIQRYRMEYQFCIRYFPTASGEYAECNETAEKMIWCLEIIGEGGDFVHGSNMRFHIGDGVLNFFVNYNEFVCPCIQAQAMDAVEINQTVEGQAGHG